MQCLVFLWSSASDPGSPLQAWSPVTLTLPRKPKRRRLKLLALNCNGPKSQTKKVELHGIINLHSPDIVIGCELKLDSSVPFYSIFPDSYTIYRLDRSQHGGRVFIAAKHDLITTEETYLQATNCEIIWVSIQFSRTKNSTLAATIARPIQELIQSKHSMIRWAPFIAGKQPFPKLCCVVILTVDTQTVYTMALVIQIVLC